MSADDVQSEHEPLSDPDLFEAIGTCCSDRGQLQMSPRVKDLIARFAPVDRPYVCFIPQERRHAFLGELSQMTGRILPREAARNWDEFMKQVTGTSPETDTALTCPSEVSNSPATVEGLGVSPATDTAPTCPPDAANPPTTVESVGPSRAKIATDLVAAHNHLIHKLAAPLTGKGKIIVAGFGEKPTQVDDKTGKPGQRLRPRVYHVDVGDQKATAESIAAFLGQRHYNLYMPLAVYGPGLPAGQKGSEADIIACLGLVADFDDSDAGRWAERLPIPPTYVLETSAGRFQAFYLFDKPEPVEAAKPVAERLKSFAQCDHGTSDLSHVWRVPGALNWPNAKKVAEGRSPEPQLVRVARTWDGSTTPLQTLSDALPGATPTAAKSAKSQPPSPTADPIREAKYGPHPASIAGTPENVEALTRMASLPPDLQEEIRGPASGDRSKAIFKVIAKLVEQGLDDAAVLNLISAHPGGIGEKYADRTDLDREVARVRAKTWTPTAAAISGVAEPAEDSIAAQGATRPVVQLRAGTLPLIVDRAEQHLIAADSGVFQRGSLMVRPVRDMIPTIYGQQTLGTRLVQVGVHHLVERFSRVVDFQKSDRNGTWFSADCPKQVAEAYLGREGEWKLPILTRIINTPTLREDGSVLEEPGYDPASGLLFDPQGIQFPAVLPEPNLLDAAEAAFCLDGLLDTFPFVDDASRAVALSAILTSLIRPSLPASPLHAFTAPVRGAGKSLLVDIASMIASGHEAPVIAQGHTAEEFEKRLGAMFLAGDATIAIDNCERPLEGEFLCQVLTQPRVTIRELGHSRKVVVPTNASLFATGNNLQIKGDLTRRTIVCFLDPRCERPELRSFETSPLELIRRERPRYVGAALTLLRYAASDQIPSWAICSPLGSFERWSRWVRAAVLFATGTDPCTTMERIQTQDPEVERLVAVLHEWTSAIGERAVTTSEVIDIATKQRPLHAIGVEEKRFVHDTFREALLVVAGIGGAVDSRCLGVWLGRNKDRIVGGKKIVMGPMASGLNQWQVVPADGIALREAA